jgi:RNase adapter protein RapZ
MKQLDIKIITGLSGSGKSTALNALADAGFYCVDNMPVALLPKFLEMPVEAISDIHGLAFGMDLREKEFLTAYADVFTQLQNNNYHLEILFLEADEEVLVRRYSQTRRHHPLAEDKGILHGIRTEQEKLRALRQASDKIIDTSALNTHKLKALLLTMIRDRSKLKPMLIHLISFGFKYGIPNNADTIIDVRFLPNPYFIDDLKHLDGKDKKINNYVLDNETGTIFLDKLISFVDFLVPLYQKEAKAYWTLAIGCTGGRHRSVAVAVEVYNHLAKTHRQVEITHRDIWQEQPESITPDII